MINDIIISKDDLVFDIGSNIGDKSQEYLNRGARVIAFEPQENCYLHAVSRFTNNPNYNAENVALDERVGTSTLYIASYHTISSMSTEFIEESRKERFPEYNWNFSKTVKTDTLDNMIVKYGKPNYIKIDVEGYEPNVLRGLSQQINLISIEFNPELCSKTLECIEYVERLNGNETVFNYGYRNDQNFMFDEWVDRDKIETYLKSINDYKFEFGDVYMKATTTNTEKSTTK
jgi:FkbM family methyltransferase